MRRPEVFVGLATVALALAACSDQTQQATEKAAASAGEDIEAAADVLKEEASEAASKAGAALDEAGDRIEAKRAENQAEAATETPVDSGR